jgi:hypothetical protein
MPTLSLWSMAPRRHATRPLDTINTSEDYSDPKVGFFRVVPLGVTADNSAAACAPQIYFTWGYQGRRDGNGVLFSKLFGSRLGAQVHSFAWANATRFDGSGTIQTAGLIDKLEGDIKAQQFSRVVLFGQSFGGTTAVKIAKDIADNQTAFNKKQVDYMALFDPVINPEIEAEGASATGVSEINPQFEGDDPNTTPNFLMPETIITLPSSVQRANNWWDTYNNEYVSSQVFFVTGEFPDQGTASKIHSQQFAGKHTECDDTIAYLEPTAGVHAGILSDLETNSDMNHFGATKFHWAWTQA